MKTANSLKRLTMKPFVVGSGVLFSCLLIIGLVIDIQADSGELGTPPVLPDAPIVEAERPLEVAGALVPRAYLPIIIKPEEQFIWVNTENRQEVIDFYQIDYQASENVAIGWTGDRGSCNPGTTTAAFKAAIVNRINYFRKMAGIPPILGLRDDYNQKAQQAALMMSVNNALSHDPPSSWTCYTVDGDQAAGSSNLYLGVYGPSAISGYIYDPGSGNYFVGHRRWILYPRTQYMGTGDIPSSGGRPSNALWVFDKDKLPSRPTTRDAFVAWPPSGYVPYQVVYPRWSFAYDKADFSSATVTMTKNGVPVSVAVQPVGNGYGENTLVWEPNLTISAPSSDEVFHITINQVGIGGSPQTFNYDVIMINPGG